MTDYLVDTNIPIGAINCAFGGVVGEVLTTNMIARFEAARQE